MQRIDSERLRTAARRAFAGSEAVAAAYAYGSRISGRPHGESDLDVAVVLRRGEEDPDPLFPERLANRLAEALGETGEIDLRLAERLPLALRGRIVTEGVMIFESDPPRRVEFETDTRREYFDFLPLIERDAREGITARG